jgi:hypothetical protein
MHIGIIGDRRARLSPGWTRETVVGILGDSEINASDPGPDARIKVIGLFSDTTIQVPPGLGVKDGGFSLFGDREVRLTGGGGREIRIDTYGLFCDLKVVEAPAQPPG